MNSDEQLTGADLYQRQLLQTDMSAPVIVCDGLQTPENLGSIFRVADALGSKGIILIDNEIDLTHNKISKISRSANKHIPLKEYSFDEFINIRKQFIQFFALEITSHSVDAFDSNISTCDAILLGHESRGINEKTLALCDASFHLPMFGVNGSMNISHALTAFLYEWRRQTKP